MVILFVISLENYVSRINNKGYLIAFLAELARKRGRRSPDQKVGLHSCFIRLDLVSFLRCTILYSGLSWWLQFEEVITTCIAAKGTPRITRILVKEMTN